MRGSAGRVCAGGDSESLHCQWDLAPGEKRESQAPTEACVRCSASIHSHPAAVLCIGAGAIDGWLNALQLLLRLLTFRLQSYHSRDLRTTCFSVTASGLTLLDNLKCSSVGSKLQASDAIDLQLLSSCGDSTATSQSRQTIYTSL